jgi:hypothetical protein
MVTDLGARSDAGPFARQGRPVTGRAILLATLALLAAPPVQADACLFRECWGGVGLTAELEGIWAVGRASRAGVLEDARAQCDGPCVVLRTFQNACGAIALKRPRDGTPLWGWSIQESRFEAESQALEGCRDHGAPGACTIVAWACSFPYP